MGILVGFIIFTAIAMLIAGLRKVSIGYTFLWCFLTPLAGIIYASIKTPKPNREEIREQSITKKFNQLNQLKALKEEGVISEEEFEQKKKLLKNDLEIPAHSQFVTIKHLQGRPETITIQQWEKLKNNFGQEKYEVLGYH